MIQPGRKYSVDSYRYGFNGKENDNEVKGEGTQQDYGMRIYDPRLGRFLSVDPIAKDYPELTSYQFASNTPIWAIDLDGLEALALTPTGGGTQTGTTAVGNSIKEWWNAPTTNPIAKDLERKYDVTIKTNGDMMKWSFANSVNHVGNNAVSTGGPTGGRTYTVKTNTQSQKTTTITATPQAPKVTADVSNKASTLKLSNAQIEEIKIWVKQNAAKTNTGAVNLTPKFGGRTIIVDENLSPTIAVKLKDAGYNVKIFNKGTTDADIISWAKMNNGAVLTNNIKDFKNKGVMTLEVPVSLTSKNNVQSVVDRVNVINRNIEMHGTGTYNSNSNVNLEKDAAVQHK
jgi:RHS repeat-associated protein